MASPYVQSSLNITQKLEVLSHDSRYDLACACATAPDEHRYRSVENRWIYPVSFTSGKKTFLFKTLLSNFCRLFLDGGCLQCLQCMARPPTLPDHHNSPPDDHDLV
ncbi:MAG: hypothetical protein KBB01_06570, partial [Candidatus Omnitrophica bacterium]|nr:hypothetical protein [Candidatus Omnitrophota bacterium]